MHVAVAPLLGVAAARHPKLTRPMWYYSGSASSRLGVALGLEAMRMLEPGVARLLTKKSYSGITLV